jgi:hypothetical protein
MYDVPIPKDMDGKPIIEIFKNKIEKGFVNKVFAKSSNTDKHEESSLLTEEEKREIIKDLQDLGYV